MIELPHDGGFGEEVPPLPLGVACFQRLNRHNHLPAPGLFEASAAHLAKFTCIDRMVKGKGEQGVREMGERGAEERIGGVEGQRRLGRVQGRGSITGRIRE